MNLKILRPIAAALAIASLAPVVNAESLGDHPAVLIARTWSAHAIDANTFIVGPAAGMLLASTGVSNSSHTSASSRPTDAQAQAAALLSGPVISSDENAQLRSSAIAGDAQASASALLSGSHFSSAFNESQQPSHGRVADSAQAQAASVLSGSHSRSVGL